MTWFPADDSRIRPLGRTTATGGGLNLFWTASGAVVRADCTEIAAVFEADWETYEPWVSVLADGAWIARVPMNRGTNRVTLARSLAAGTPHVFRVQRDGQAMYDDPRHKLRLLGFEVGGELLDAGRAERVIEFVGDSITSGEGAVGALCEMDWSMAWFSSVRSWPTMTADLLGADARVVSQSGWGIRSGWDNTPDHAIPKHYVPTCGLCRGAFGQESGALEPYDFAAHPADAVVVNLGTNDDGAFHDPPWTDPDTGETFEQRLLPDGTPDPRDLALLRTAVRDFMGLIREKNPGAHILWVYGMLGHLLAETIRAGVGDHAEATGDANCGFLLLPDTAQGMFGSRGHPGLPAHRAAAEAVAAYLKPVLGI